ncbi:MAG: YgcG family protein, partial [Mesorhizobium sp.]|nr:YgcG family protein [Mesorhizobium sp.]
MGRSAFVGVLFSLFCLLFPLAALAADLPALTGRVVDDANLIDAATKVLLTQKLADFEAKGSDQIVVATIPSLDGEEIEPYANRLFRFWKLGQAKENNGVLLLVAKNDRKMRIEVGYGLEGTLTDLHTKLIIENDMVPAFRAGDFSGGIEKAVDDMIMVLQGNPEELEARGKRNEQAPFNSDDLFFAIFITIWVLIFFGGIAMSVLPPIFGQKIGPGRYRWLDMTFEPGRGSSSG